VAEVVSKEKRGEAVTVVTPVEDQAGDARVDLDLIEYPEGRLGPESERSRDEVLLSSLRLAFEHLERLLGADVRFWEWGKLHHAFLAHPFSPLFEEWTRERLNVGPAPRAGSGDTVGNTAYGTDDFRQTGGSSWRVVVDVGNWDGCLAINTPGQSGDLRSPHYADLFSRWAADQMVPLLYSRESIEATAEKRIVLQPVE
jgi:penicillin G amidase